MPQDPTQMFQGPIPGQSWSQAPGSYPWQTPPRFTDPQEASEATWATLTHPRTALQNKIALQSGIPAEILAEGILMGGFMKGMWTPDIAHIISTPVLGQVVASAEASGLKAGKDYQIFKPDKDLAKYIATAEVSKQTGGEPDTMGNTTPAGGKAVSPDEDVGGEDITGEQDDNRGLLTTGGSYKSTVDKPVDITGEQDDNNGPLNKGLLR